MSLVSTPPKISCSHVFLAFSPAAVPMLTLLDVLSSSADFVGLGAGGVESEQTDAGEPSPSSGSGMPSSSGSGAAVDSASSNRCCSLSCRQQRCSGLAGPLRHNHRAPRHVSAAARVTHLFSSFCSTSTISLIKKLRNSCASWCRMPTNSSATERKPVSVRLSWALPGPSVCVTHAKWAPGDRWGLAVLFLELDDKALGSDHSDLAAVLLWQRGRDGARASVIWIDPRSALLLLCIFSFIVWGRRGCGAQAHRDLDEKIVEAREERLLLRFNPSSKSR